MVAAQVAQDAQRVAHEAPFARIDLEPGASDLVRRAEQDGVADRQRRHDVADVRHGLQVDPDAAGRRRGGRKKRCKAGAEVRDEPMSGRMRKLAATTVLLACCAVPAQASVRVSAHGAARIRAALARQVKRDPSVVTRRWFLRRAGLVKFALPVTLRLRDDGAPTATADLGASLGSRAIALGGSLAARVLFSDDLDGGTLGDVSLQIVPSQTQFLRTSSVPLLWNSEASDPATRFDADLLAPAPRQGCGDFTRAGSNGDGYVALFHGLASEEPGYPYYDGGPSPAGYLPIYPGVDAVDNLHSGAVVGDDDWLGPDQHPFPDAAPGVQDTVLRTNALRLQVAPEGTRFDQGVIGASGGQANLFGAIPGRSVGVDVTLSLMTTINGIERVVDQDTSGLPLQSGASYPAALLQCHQVWTGAVQNYLPAIHLEGQLRIAPAITADGRLRIAKATVASPADRPARVALSACLLPVTTYAVPTGAAPLVPPDAGGQLLAVDSGDLPVDDQAEQAAPAGTPCNAQPDPLLAATSLQPLAGGGSQVTVAGDVTVNATTVDVLIGDA
jgi:hypothetical protein